MNQVLAVALGIVLATGCGGAGGDAGAGGPADPGPGDSAPDDANDDGPADPAPGGGGQDGDDGAGDPGDVDPGDADPGDADPGDADPGDADPGDEDPGDVDPGDDDPGDEEPGGLEPPEDPPPRERDPDCAYPGDASRSIRQGAVTPRLAWDRAFTGAGDIIRFDLEDVYCDPQWDRYKILIFVVGTTWCPYCPGYMQTVAAQSRQLDEWGAQVVYVEAQNNVGRPISTRDAFIYLQRLLGEGSDIRVGDGDTRPSPALIQQAEFLTGFPTSFVVRTRDMRVITHQGLMRGGLLPFLAIAQSPDADWSDPNKVPVGPSNCDDEDQEDLEPNDTPWQGGDLDGEAVVSGGICNKTDDAGLMEEDEDYYDIPAGSWRITVEHDASMGNLDLYLWDKRKDDFSVHPDGGPVGSTTLDDIESFEHTSTGSFTIAILGFFGSTGPYTLTLEQL